MKKLLALLLSLTMVFGMVACGSKSDTPADDSSKDPGTTETTAMSPEEIKVGVILLHDENSAYDMAHKEGIETACAELGIPKENVTYKLNIPEDATCYDMAADLADAGCDIIFSDSYGHQTHMMQAAAEFPDTIFVACTGDQAAVSGMKNVKNIFPYTYESRYVSGVVAGMKLKELLENGEITEPKVGYVGAFPYAEVVSGYTAFLLGIQSIVPEATMEVQYTNVWFGLTQEAEAANVLMDRGAVIISQHADSTGAPSAVQAAWESGKPVYSVGYNIDMQAAAPDAALTSAQNVWSVLYKHTLETFLAGEEIPADFACGYADGAQSISALGKNCAEGTQEAVDAAWAGLKDGSLHIFDTSKFTVDGETVTSSTFDLSIVDFVTGKVLYEGDTVECIKDGYFEESVHRAAPYFSLRIDGITELNAQ